MKPKPTLEIELEQQLERERCNRSSLNLSLDTVVELADDLRARLETLETTYAASREAAIAMVDAIINPSQAELT